MAGCESKPDIDIPIDDALKLCTLGPGDAEVVSNTVKRNIKHLQEYGQHTVDACGTLVDAKEYITSSDSSSLRLGIWVCRAAGIEEFAGAITATFDKVNNQVEIGYWLDANHTSNGYARMAVAALTRYILSINNCTNIVAKVIDGNTASEAVLKKSGFKLKGTVTEPPKGATNGESVTKFVYVYRPAQLQAGK